MRGALAALLLLALVPAPHAGGCDGGEGGCVEETSRRALAEGPSTGGIEGALSCDVRWEGSAPRAQLGGVSCSSNGMCCSGGACLNGTVAWQQADGVATIALRRPESHREGCVELLHTIVVESGTALEVVVGFPAWDGETMPTAEDWAALSPLTKLNDTQTIDSVIRMIFFRISLGNATGNATRSSGEAVSSSGGSMRWAWRAVSSESSACAPKFVAKDSNVVAYAFVLDLGVLFWMWLAVSLWHVICGEDHVEEWRQRARRRGGAVKQRALPTDEGAAEIAEEVQLQQLRKATVRNIPGTNAVAGTRSRLRTSIDASVSGGLRRFADLARISIMTDAGDAHLQRYESQIAVAKGKGGKGKGKGGQVYQLTLAQRDAWREQFLRDSPFLWWLEALKLPLRGSRSNPGVREIAGGRAVLYLELLAALANLLGGCCILATLVLLPTVGTGAACTTASGGGGVDLLCRMSAANVGDGDAVRLWAMTLTTLLFAAFAWWISTRAIRRQTGPGHPDVANGRPAIVMDVGPAHVPFYTLMIRHIPPVKGRELLRARRGIPPRGFEAELEQLFRGAIAADSAHTLVGLKLVSPAPRRYRCLNWLSPLAMTAFLTFNDAKVPAALYDEHRKRYGGRLRWFARNLCCCCARAAGKAAKADTPEDESRRSLVGEESLEESVESETVPKGRARMSTKDWRNSSRADAHATATQLLEGGHRSEASPVHEREHPRPRSRAGSGSPREWLDASQSEAQALAARLLAHERSVTVVENTEGEKEMNDAAPTGGSDVSVEVGDESEGSGASYLAQTVSARGRWQQAGEALRRMRTTSHETQTARELASVVWDTVDAGQDQAGTDQQSKQEGVRYITARGVGHWKLCAGPEASDIIWSALGSAGWVRALRRWVIFIVLLGSALLLAFPATTASTLGRVINMALRTVSSRVKVADEYNGVSGLDESLFGTPVHTLAPDEDCGQRCTMLSEYLPSLAALLTNSILLPVVVTLAAPLEGWLLRTEVFRSILRKTAALLFCSTLIFPSLAIVSAELWIDGLSDYIESFSQTFDAADAGPLEDMCDVSMGATTYDDEWKITAESIADQLRQPLLVARRSLGSTLTQNGGSFFLLYVLQSAFLSNASALALLPARSFALLGKLYSCVFSKCSDSAAATGESIASWQFPLEYHVAVVCVIFAVVLTFSLVTPLILFVGLLYIVIKATADRFVLLFGHDGDLDERFSQDHDSAALFSTADTFVMLAVTVMLVSNLQFMMEKQAPYACITLLGLGVAVACVEVWRKSNADSSGSGWAQKRELPPLLPKQVAKRTLALPGYYNSRRTTRPAK